MSHSNRHGVGEVENRHTPSPNFHPAVQPLEKMNAVTRNLMFSLRHELSDEYSKIQDGEIYKNSHPRRKDFLIAFGKVIMQHKETYATTGKIQYARAHSDNMSQNADNVQHFLSFPFRKDFKFFHLVVTEHVPCDVEPTYTDDLTAIANLTHLMYHVCHEQTKLLKTMTEERGKDVEEWQGRDEYWLHFIVTDPKDVFCDYKRNVAKAALTAEANQALVLGIYDSFGGSVNGCTNILQLHDKEYEAKVAEWERTENENLWKALNLRAKKEQCSK